MGTSVLGNFYDIHDIWLLFDGNKLHFADSFSGCRVSLIFFVPSAFERVGGRVRASLFDHWFDFDWDWHRTHAAAGCVVLPQGPLAKERTTARKEN